MSNKILLGIAGPARSGKNEIAKYLVKYHAFREDSFAGPIRQSVISLLGLRDLDHLDEIKHLPHPVLGGKTPRLYMQLMGTEFGRRMIDEDIWVAGCLHRSGHHDRFVISDVRFNNEAEAIKFKSDGGKIIRVDRPDVRIDENSHESEAGIDPKYIDFEIINDQNLAHLYKNIESVMKELFKGMK